jgi:ABC-type sulfate transport system substrate-binding protein
MGYDIGYRRPPKNGQFRKGESGNPKGRPKGARNFVTLLEKELRQTVVVNESGKKKTITRLQAMVKRMVADALQGDRKAQLTLVDVLRKTGRLEQADFDSVLPNDYEDILETYIARRQKSRNVNTDSAE